MNHCHHRVSEIRSNHDLRVQTNRAKHACEDVSAPIRIFLTAEKKEKSKWREAAVGLC
jgi:hypothetical protein